MGESGKKFVKLLIILLYCVFVILGLAFLFICFELKPKFYNDEEKFNSIMQMNKEDLLNMNNYDKNKFNFEIMEHLSLIFAKFASYPYDKNKYYSSKRFLNFDIINYGSKSDDNYFFTFKNDSLKTVIISFPGTLSKPQLLDEVFGSGLISFEESKQVLIGKYFGKRTEILLELIFNDELEKLIKNNYQIISTGHSLGGAMAQCFMYFALSKGKINENNFPMTITFGQPKVGNVYFSNYLDDNAFLNLRFVNKDDIVTKIPFCSGFINHIKYYFNILDDDKIYWHTKKEYKQHNICNLPTILFIIFKLEELLIFLFKFALLLIPIIIIISYLLSIYHLQSKIENKYNKYLIKLCLVLFIICSIIFIFICIYFSYFKKYSLLTSIVLVLLFMLISPILIYIVIIFLVDIIHLIILCDCCGNCKSNFGDEEKKFFSENCNCKTIYNFIVYIITGLCYVITYFKNISQHMRYQNSNDNYLTNEVKIDSIFPKYQRENTSNEIVVI